MFLKQQREKIFEKTRRLFCFCESACA